jgi:hypothetical protein
MKLPRLYLNKEVAEMCGCSVQAAQHYAQNPEHEINSIGDGQRKTFIWLYEDIEKFKKRPGPGRRPRQQE